MDAYREMLFRSRIAQVEMEALAMRAANQERADAGEHQAYGEEQFDQLRAKLAVIELDIQKVGIPASGPDTLTGGA